MQIFSYWEPRSNIPYYLQLCVETWKKFLPGFPITILDNSNIRNYIDIDSYGANLFSGKFSLPQIADAVRAMLLEKYGGIWLDLDTIVVNGSAQLYFYDLDEHAGGGYEVTLFGDPITRSCHLAAIKSIINSRLMRFWLQCVRDRVNNFNPPQKDFWGYLGNACVDSYIKTFPEEIKIIDRREVMPELALDANSIDTYLKFYFLQNKHLKDIETNMMLLHNSWTPDFFKKLDRNEFLKIDCTMSNVLCEILELDRSHIKQFVRIKTSIT